MADFQMVNKMEMAVKHTLDEILSRNHSICSCERCKLDLMALTLNNLPPRYVVTTFGDVMTQFDLDSFQWKTDVMIAVIRALEVVKQKPRHKL